MEANRFDRISRSLAAGASRRGIVGGLMAGAMVLLGAELPAPVSGRKRKRRKRKPLQRNAYGCVDVGKRCRGKDTNCCSGICQGKKPKRGKKDTSKCIAHDTGGCQAGQRQAFCGGSDVACTTSLGNPGFCNTTTGNAGFCTRAEGGVCHACQTDAECQTYMADPRAACGVCAGCPEGTGCAVP